MCGTSELPTAATGDVGTQSNAHLDASWFSPPSHEGTEPKSQPAPSAPHSSSSVVETAVLGTAVVASGIWGLVKFVVVALGLVIFIGGYVYSNNESFKVACGIHKLGGPDLPFPKNLICALDFQIGGDGH